MTTIAYKDGIVAYDSRMTASNVIIDDEFDKCVVLGGHKFFMSGVMPDALDIADAVVNGEEGDFQAEGLMTVGLELFGVSGGEGGPHVMPFQAHKSYSYGSGSLHAMTAMDMGATAKEAVQMAMKRDACTGGKIRTLKLK